MNQKWRNGGIAFIGYLLSPLSPENDIFINIPIAYGLASLVGLVVKGLFYPSLIAFYWFTNFAGLFLMHYGISRGFSKNKHYSKRQVFFDILMSVFITAVLIFLIHINLLRFPTDYFNQ